MNNDKLDSLVASGAIKSYVYRTLDMDGHALEIAGNGSREAEEVLLTFSNGETLAIEGVCSGSMENTSLIFTVLDSVETSQFATGAMFPPELAWQEGKTAGEIVLLQFVLRVRDFLPRYNFEEEGAIWEEANYLLVLYGVEKHPKDWDPLPIEKE